MHFTLVVVCIGLLVAKMLDTSAAVERAYGDVQAMLAIQDLVERQEAWVQEYADDWFGAYLDRHPELAVPSQAFEVRYKTQQGSRLVTVCSPDSPWVLSNPSLSVQEAKDDIIAFRQNRYPIVKRLTSLADFHRLWQFLGSSQTIVRGTKVQMSDDAVIAAVHHTDRTGTIRTADVMLDDGCDLSAEMAWDPGSQAYILETSWYEPDRFAVPREGRAPASDESASSGSDQHHIHLSVLTAGVPLTNPGLQKMLANDFNVLWRPGKFEETFADLTEVTNGVTDVSLADLGKLMDAERKRAGERFEFFGTKIPGTALSRWGLLILVALQAYLWLHLRALRATLQSIDVSFAWIGLYPHLASRAACAVSAGVLPILAAITMLAGGWGREHGWWYTWVIGAVLASFTFACAAVLLLWSLPRAVKP